MGLQPSFSFLSFPFLSFSVTSHYLLPSKSPSTPPTLRRRKPPIFRPCFGTDTVELRDRESEREGENPKTNPCCEVRRPPPVHHQTARPSLTAPPHACCRRSVTPRAHACCWFRRSRSGMCFFFFFFSSLILFLSSYLFHYLTTCYFVSCLDSLVI